MLGPLTTQTQCAKAYYYYYYYYLSMSSHCAWVTTSPR